MLALPQVLPQLAAAPDIRQAGRHMPQCQLGYTDVLR
jgi:hypothetical protein